MGLEIQEILDILDGLSTGLRCSSKRSFRCGPFQSFMVNVCALLIFGL